MATSKVSRGELQPLLSLRTCATLPACQTRPISFLVVPTLNSSFLFFGCIPSDAERPGARVFAGLANRLKLKCMARKLGLARRRRDILFAVRKLPVNALNCFK